MVCVDTSFSRLSLLVAETAKWQEITGTANRTQAERHVHLTEANDEVRFDQMASSPPAAPSTEKIHLYPRCILIHEGGGSAEQVSPGHFRYSGQALMTIQMEVPASVTSGSTDPDKFTDERAYAANVFETIAKEMLALSGLGESVAGETHMNIDRMTVNDGPWIESPEEREHQTAGQYDNLWWQEWLIEWSS